MSLFSNMGKAFARDDKVKQEADELNAEAKSFDLAKNGGYLTFVKYSVYIVLAAFNWKLFTTVVPGAWGVLVGCVAILSEGFAIYCFNNQNKSVDSHRTALQVFAVYFTILSFLHAAASFYDTIGAGPDIGRPLYVYAHYVAFPLIFSSMVAGVMILTLTHWSSKISADRAKAHQEIEASRADLITQHSVMQHQATLERQRLSHMAELLQLEHGYVEKLQEYARIKEREGEIINGVADPTLRDRLQKFTGNLIEGVARPTYRAMPAAAPALSVRRGPKARLTRDMNSGDESGK